MYSPAETINLRRKPPREPVVFGGEGAASIVGVLWR